MIHRTINHGVGIVGVSVVLTKIEIALEVVGEGMAASCAKGSLQTKYRGKLVSTAELCTKTQVKIAFVGPRVKRSKGEGRHRFSTNKPVVGAILTARFMASLCGIGRCRCRLAVVGQSYDVFRQKSEEK